MMKLTKGKQTEQHPDHLQPYAHFAGITSTSSHCISSHFDTCVVQHSYGGSWIVDTDASDHITY